MDIGHDMTRGVLSAIRCDPHVVNLGAALELTAVLVIYGEPGTHKSSAVTPANDFFSLQGTLVKLSSIAAFLSITSCACDSAIHTSEPWPAIQDHVPEIAQSCRN
jgi:hypothetical protein